MVLKRVLSGFVFAYVVCAANACVTFDDRCVDVRCSDGEICVDKEPAPLCVCDDAHVLDDEGVCVAVDGDEGDANTDAGSED